MLTYVFWGALYGLVSTTLAGQLFLMLMNASLKLWFKKSLPFIIWANVSDPVIALSAYFIVSNFINYDFDPNVAFLGYLSSFILLVFWTALIFQNVSISQSLNDRNMIWHLNFYLFSKAFIVNISNPVMWITWMVISSYFLTIGNFMWFVFFMIGAFTIITWADFLKSYYAQFIVDKLGDRKMSYIYRTLWVIVILLALLLSYRTYLCRIDFDNCFDNMSLIDSDMFF